jgi:hypothetical protein
MIRYNVEMTKLCTAQVHIGVADLTLVSEGSEKMPRARAPVPTAPDRVSHLLSYRLRNCHQLIIGYYNIGSTLLLVFLDITACTARTTLSAHRMVIVVSIG